MHDRYPENTNISVEDFKSSDWLDILNGLETSNYTDYWQKFSSEAQDSLNDNNKKSKFFWLLADACSMQLKANSVNNPFTPSLELQNKRSAITEDFNQEDIHFFSDIIPLINHSKLCARLSDIVWLRMHPKNPKFALLAIDNYIDFNLSYEIWDQEIRQCLDRAIQLSFLLRKTAISRLKNIEDSIVSSLINSSTEEKSYANSLADLLMKHKLGSKQKKDIANKLEQLAEQFENKNFYYLAINYYNSASEWHLEANNIEQSNKMIAMSAECIIKEITFPKNVTKQSTNLSALKSYEKAILKYRSIPKKFRNEKINLRISELQSSLNSAGQNSLDEMNYISSEPIDISEITNYSIKAVKDKALPDALLQFANIYTGPKVENIQSLSKEIIEKYPLQHLFSSTMLASDGRVIAKKPGADLEGSNQDVVIWPEMIKNYLQEIQLVVQGQIFPALTQMRIEHRLQEIDFYSFVKNSPIVPINRIRIISKGLFYGYDNDFTIAIHLISPQIENIVRQLLKQHGEVTSHLDIHGIETEKGLSTLIENPKVTEIFGKDLTFELKAIFCDSFGPNLRNEIAHGLIGYDESQNIYSIYAWWLSLRVIFNTYWNSQKNNN